MEALSRSWSDGLRIGGDCWIQGCPVHFSAGGVGARRFLAMAPDPASRELWESVAEGHRNANLVESKDVDARGSVLDSLSRRGKKPATGGCMTAFSSSTSRRRSLPPTWLPRKASQEYPHAKAPGNDEDREYC